MTEIMDANVRKACCLCKQFIFIFDCGITQAFYPAAHSKVITEMIVPHLALLMLR